MTHLTEKPDNHSKDTALKTFKCPFWKLKNLFYKNWTLVKNWISKKVYYINIKWLHFVLVKREYFFNVLNVNGDKTI